MILITGGTGYIGSHLAAHLVAQGEPVRLFGRFSHDSTTRMNDLLGKVDVHEGNLLDELAVSRASAGVEIIYHLGAVSTLQDDPAIMREMVHVNISGTLNLLIAAHNADVRRIVFASSSAVYGDSAVSPKREDAAVEPKSPYGISKLAGEQLCGSFHRMHGLETVVLRYFNVYGPGQMWDTRFPLAIPRFLNALSNGEQIALYGGGKQTRDFVYIDDVIASTVRAGVAPAAAGLTLNVGSGHPTSIRDVLFLMAEMLGVTPDVLDMPPRPGDILESVADISAARNVLGYEPSFSIEDGLRRLRQPTAISVASI